MSVKLMGHNGGEISHKKVLQYVKIALFVAAFIALLPFGYFGTLSSDLDGSWRFALNYLSANHAKFGDSHFFTYGPLGFLCGVRNVGHNLYFGIIFWAVIVCIQLYLFKRIYDSKRNEIFVCGFLLLVILAAPISEADIYLCFLDLLAVMMVYDDDYKGMPIAFFLSVFMFFFKFSGEIVVLSALAMMPIATVVSGGRDVKKKAAFAFSVILAGPACYLVYHPSISDLGAYVRAIIEISSGYNLSMSLEIYKGYYVWVVLMVVCYLALLLVSLAADKRSFGVLLILCPCCFFWYKEGFVRTDHYHLGFTGMLLACSILLCFIDWKQFASGAAVFGKGARKGSFCIIGIMFTLSLMARGNTLSSALVTAANGFINSPLTLLDIYHQDFTQLKQENEKFMDVIGNDTYSNFPWSITENAAYENQNFMIPPLLQNYTVYTPYLDQLNAEFYHGDKAPEYIIFSMSTIDWRIPLVETPKTWERIYQNYNIVQYDGTKFLLKKRECALEKEDSESTVKESGIDEKITVPMGSNFVKISAELSLRGRIELLLYKVLPVHLTVEYTDGSIKTGRVIMDNLKEGIDLNTIACDDADFVRCMNQDESEKQVKEFYFSGNGTSQYKNQIRVEFCTRRWDDK